MRPYPLTQSQTSLQDLPALRDSAGYRIIEGDPRASIRFDHGCPTCDQRLGIWQCTAGVFECIESGNELQTILEGRLRVTDEAGHTIEYGPGDSFYTEKGEKLTWDIVETVKKVFFTYDHDGHHSARKS